jgi:hypothetical protein
LVGELAQQAFFTIWPEVEADQVRMRAITASLGNEVVNDNWVQAGTFNKKVQEERRLSQVHIYFGRKNPVVALDEKKNYSVRLVVADFDAEGSDQYGSASIKEIFSRWLLPTAFDAADFCGQRILSVFRDPPIETSFELFHSHTGRLFLSEPFRLESADIQDALGAPSQVVMYPTKVEKQDFSEAVSAQQVRFATAIDDTKDIVIASDVNDFDMRAAFEALFGTPSVDDVIVCTVLPGVVVGSSSSTTPAFTTGTWPALTTPPLIVNSGRIAGRGGKGGNGGLLGIDSGNGQDGEDGSLALEALAAVDFDNTDGTIAGGGGGGGGGGRGSGVNLGGGAGGGAGRDEGTGGFGANVGQDGTPTAGGSGGLGGGGGGTGGTGGAPATNGTAGGNGFATGGAAGAAGGAIDGDSNITFSDEGTILGSRIN